jgi:hypothetical protein
MNMEAEGSVALEAITRLTGEDTVDREYLVCAIMNR